MSEQVRIDLSGAAFPHDYLHIPGLTKREWYAGLAMQGAMAADVDDVASHDDIALAAVRQADALLAALTRPPQQEQA